MKSYLLPMVLLVASCGDSVPGNGSMNRVGETRSLLSTVEVSSLDRQNLATICTALAQKEVILPTALNSAHTFFTSQTDCEGKVTSAGDVGVTIQNSGGYMFRRTDGQSFVFPDVETANSGVFKDICGSLNLSPFSSPLRSASEVLYFGTLGISSADCPQRDGELCFSLERAFIQGTAAVVHTQEWIRIRTNPQLSKIGFFTHRKKITKSFCGQGQSQAFTATLK